MRLFVAVDLDAGTRAQLTPARDAIRAWIERAPVAPRVTWVRDDQAHVTLRFLGETPEDTAGAIVHALSAGFERPAFDVQWRHIGTFPPDRTPRVVWVGAAGGAGELAALANDVNGRLEPIVGPPEKRPFSAHITLGRVKERGRQVDWAGALASVRFGPTTTRVDHVTLYASRLSPKGPTYTAVCTADLK